MNIYALLRNPHIARNEEALVKPLKKIGTYREKYLSGLNKGFNRMFTILARGYLFHKACGVSAVRITV